MVHGSLNRRAKGGPPCTCPPSHPDAWPRVAAIACAAALIPVVSQSPPPAAPASAPRRGQHAGLPDGRAGGVAGQRRLWRRLCRGLLLRPSASPTCPGTPAPCGAIPGVSAVTLGGGHAGTPGGLGDPGDARPRAVRLANGATATAVLAVTDVYNYPASVCHRVTAAGLRATPPNQFTSKLVPYPIGACTDPARSSCRRGSCEGSRQGLAGRGGRGGAARDRAAPREPSRARLPLAAAARIGPSVPGGCHARVELHHRLRGRDRPGPGAGVLRAGAGPAAGRQNEIACVFDGERHQLR